MSDHATTLRELAADMASNLATYPKGSEGVPALAREMAQIDSERAACLAGADALRREDTLRGIIESGIVRYKQNGGCSNCGGTPHTATCLVGQLELWLAAPTEPTR